MNRRALLLSAAAAAALAGCRGREHRKPAPIDGLLKDASLGVDIAGPDSDHTAVWLVSWGEPL